MKTYIEILAHLVVLICIKKCAREVYTLNPRKLWFGFPDFLMISQQFPSLKQFHKHHKLQTCFMTQKLTHLTNLKVTAHTLQINNYNNIIVCFRVLYNVNIFLLLLTDQKLIHSEHISLKINNYFVHIMKRTFGLFTLMFVQI